MSKNKQNLELFLYKNNLQSKTLIDLLDCFSNKTLEQISKELNTSYTSISNDIKSINLDSDSRSDIYIFTDGGCKNNGRKNAVAAYSVHFTEDQNSDYYKFNNSELLTNDPSNQHAELTAIYKCLETIVTNKELFSNKNIIVVTDSVYSMNCITKWSANWKKNGWKTAKGQDIKHKSLIQNIVEHYDDILSFTKLSFKHVFSHLKEPENKESMQYFLWYGNKKVDDNIASLFECN